MSIITIKALSFTFGKNHYKNLPNSFISKSAMLLWIFSSSENIGLFQTSVNIHTNNQIK